MLRYRCFAGLFCLFAVLSPGLRAQRIVTNQVGYEVSLPKHAVVMADTRQDITSFRLVDTYTGLSVYQGVPLHQGPVDKWKNRVFWTIDFSNWLKEGNYRLEVTTPAGAVSSYPFIIGKNVLEKATLSDVIYYFKGQRSAGVIDKADHHLPTPPQAPGPDPVKTSTLDLHGGWYDATGDYGIHLSHLSFSSYFNPQQVSLAVWSLLKTENLLGQRDGTDFRQFRRRLLDEAMYGADYLVRVQAKYGSFYRSIGAPGAGKLAKDRAVSPEQKSYRIKASKEATWTNDPVKDSWRSYQSSYRSGAGMAIASLAIASTDSITGEYTAADYLRAAENAFAFLEKDNPQMTNDGKENIVDDYCALSAATELYRATSKKFYQDAAEKRAQSLLARFSTWGKYKDYWRADNADRPFFHPSDAGLPIVSLLYYYPLASEATQRQIKDAVRRSMHFEWAITHEVNNPFGYSRQLVQDTLGQRHSSFFFPHGSDASPWWQGENARLGSMATAARLAARLFRDDRPFQDSLESFAVDQLNWILGCNPFDASMLQGTGRNNPVYGFFGTFEYTNAPGGIVNGITSGLNDEDDIDLNLSYAQTGKDNDWRWAEQWLPHSAWYMLAVASRESVRPTDEHADDHPTLPIGSPAPDFRLKGVDGNTWSLQSFKDAKVLVVAFICNHCPTSQAYEKRLIQLVKDYKDKGVDLVAINPNNPDGLRLDELGYSDLGDSYDDMKVRAKDAGYNFPYLYDGETEVASKQYGPVSTPHLFVFDENRILRYNGRFDDTEDPKKTPQNNDVRNAIDAVLRHEALPVAVTKVFGCSIKWKEKSDWIRKARVTWANEPVSLQSVGVDSIQALVRNHSGKLRLINLWATWCVPCVQEFPELVTISHMYRDRGLQLITISLDDSAANDKALRFLQREQSSSPNYRFAGDDKYKLIEAIDPKWQGALPYSMLVEPGGKVVYARQGQIDPEALKKLIFDSPYMGRIYK
jgi:thiol-disulfide isomerase/thioredoxin